MCAPEAPAPCQETSSSDKYEIVDGHVTSNSASLLQKKSFTLEPELTKSTLSVNSPEVLLESSNPHPGESIQEYVHDLINIQFADNSLKILFKKCISKYICSLS